ncbi:MAG: hypothetical protein VB018_11710 [Lachnospiraceae bacterium]|nr:hypothetical protein [Lachnospiraceae bacterium]
MGKFLKDSHIQKLRGCQPEENFRRPASDRTIEKELIGTYFIVLLKKSTI